MFNSILLDWDGCMADTLSIWMESYKKLFVKRNIYPSEEEIVGKAFGNWDGPASLGVTDQEVYIKELLDEVAEGLKRVRLHPHVFEIMKSLHDSGSNLAVVTTSKREIVYPLMERFGLIKYVKVVIGAEDVSKHKPDPEIAYKAMEKLGSQKESTIIVGDSEKDVLAGKSAGITTLIFYPEANRRFYREENLRQLKPDFFITDFRKLFEIANLSNDSNH